MLALIASPAAAQRDLATRQMQEEQVSDFLATLFQKDPTNPVWHWERMVEVCTKVLMYGNPEQDPESAGVRLTPASQLFLIECGEQKGFKSLPARKAPPAEPLTYTTARRMEAVSKVFSTWVVDTSTSGVTVEQRDRECTDWIATRPGWKFLVQNEPEWKSKLEKGEGAVAEVTDLLIVCAKSKGFDLRKDKMGGPIRALITASMAEQAARQK